MRLNLAIRTIICLCLIASDNRSLWKSCNKERRRVVFHTGISLHITLARKRKLLAKYCNACMKDVIYFHTFWEFLFAGVFFKGKKKHSRVDRKFAIILVGIWYINCLLFKYSVRISGLDLPLLHNKPALFAFPARCFPNFTLPTSLTDQLMDVAIKLTIQGLNFLVYCGSLNVVLEIYDPLYIFRCHFRCM